MDDAEDGLHALVTEVGDGQGGAGHLAAAQLSLRARSTRSLRIVMRASGGSVRAVDDRREQSALPERHRDTQVHRGAGTNPSLSGAGRSGSVPAAPPRRRPSTGRARARAVGGWAAAVDPAPPVAGRCEVDGGRQVVVGDLPFGAAHEVGDGTAHRVLTLFRPAVGRRRRMCGCCWSLPTRTSRQARPVRAARRASRTARCARPPLERLRRPGAPQCRQVDAGGEELLAYGVARTLGAEVAGRAPRRHG